MSAKRESIVKLDVGAIHYKTSLSTINNSPNSMLAKAVSERWKKEDSNEPIFFDRDGQRFKYVLDYLRDGKVNLPVGENVETFHTELQYFCIDIHQDSITSDEDVTLISFQQRFESHISRIEKNMKTRQRDYIIYRIGLDVYKEAVVENAKQCTSGDSDIDFEISYYESDHDTVYEVLDGIDFEDEVAKNAFFDEINTVVKDMNVVVNAIDKFTGCYEMKVGKKVKKRTIVEVTC